MEYYLGESVKLIIDRPLGSKHPKYNFIYPLNYGYIPNTISGDNEYQIKALVEFQERFFESTILMFNENITI